MARHARSLVCNLAPRLFMIYLNDMHLVSDKLNCILYIVGTTLSSPMWAFSSECDGNVELDSNLINSELNKIADWLAVNKLSLNMQKNNNNKENKKQTHDIPLPSKGHNGKWYHTPYDK